MTDKQDKVTRLRQLLREAVPVQPIPVSSPENEAWRAYQHHAYNIPAEPIDRSARAKAIREINRIACWHCWQSEVYRWLSNTLANSLGELDDRQLQELHAHMVRLESCVNDGLGSPFAPAAS